MKEDFTMVAVSHLRLANVKFMKGRMALIWILLQDNRFGKKEKTIIMEQDME